MVMLANGSSVVTINSSSSPPEWKQLLSAFETRYATAVDHPLFDFIYFVGTHIIQSVVENNLLMDFLGGGVTTSKPILTYSQGKLVWGTPDPGTFTTYPAAAAWNV